MKALELADELMSDNEHLAVSQSEIAAELRRLAAVEAELEAEREESKRWLVKAQNERDARKELEAELERIKALEPVAWLVLSTNQDGSISVEYVAEWPEAAHEHINDAISEYDNKEAASWVVRPVIYALGSKT